MPGSAATSVTGSGACRQTTWTGSGRPCHAIEVRKMSCRPITCRSASRNSPSRCRDANRSTVGSTYASAPSAPAIREWKNMPSCSGASGYTSATFRAPPGTAAVIASTCSWDRPTSGSMAGVIACAPSGIARGGTATSAVPSAAAASAAGVGAWNRARTGTPMPASRSRAASVTASRECPPSSKKLSSGPTRSRSSTSANAAQMISSARVAGGLDEVAWNSGAGRALRSIFPLTVTGSPSGSTTTAAGIM